MAARAIVSIRPDGRQSETAALLQKGVCRRFRAQGFATLCEFTLASGRRADVIALGPKGDIWIVEIKSSPEDFRADRKWPDYRDFCDRLYFAVAASMDPALLPVEAGLIIADAFGAEILRHPQETPLNAARRKAVTIGFARAAAMRLHGLYYPEMM
ncbi:MAG: MmcB family DNA repair protein [Rhizobiales bacterium]|nr:MmcB family DNA repair protein [Hyphomicrobiales bacterium]